MDGGHYQWNVTATNPGNPTVDMFLAGPVVHGNLFEKWSAYAEGLLGGVHTGGVTIQPDVSFAGGVGSGLGLQQERALVDTGIWRSTSGRHSRWFPSSRGSLRTCAGMRVPASGSYITSEFEI